MYNRYIPTGSRWETAGQPSQVSRSTPPKFPQAGSTSKSPLRSLLGGLGSGHLDSASQTVSSLLKSLHLDGLDLGDILLALIILFLILEDGDNLDLIITLGLMILFSLTEK